VLVTSVLLRVGNEIDGGASFCSSEVEDSDTRPELRDAPTSPVVDRTWKLVSVAAHSKWP
jgi:hypothetical protein